MSWDNRFPEPIELPGGVKLASLREAIVHLVNTIPSSERGTPVVLTAAELITSAAEHGGPIEFARIATLRAINRHVVREFNPDRKDTHWGGRKLARDRWVPEQINRRRFDFPVRLSWVVSWDKRFDRSVILPGGKTLLMLEDARRHI